MSMTQKNWEELTKSREGMLLAEFEKEIATKDAEIERLKEIINSQTRALDRWVERFADIKAREALQR